MSSIKELTTTDLNINILYFINFIKLEVYNEKTKNKDGIFKLLNSKVLKPTNEEIKLNIASRSAKLRAAQLL